MNAEIIAVGSEMLTPDKIDTNSLYLTHQLNTLGVEVVQKAIVGDDRERLAAVIRQGLERSDILILTGGLGPTEDDVTRDAVAAALGVGQTFHPEVVAWIAELFARLKRSMAENNKRQAFILDGAEILNNDRGTAPGQWFSRDGRIVMLLPGPPREMRAMWEQQALPRLEKVLPPMVIRTIHMRVAGMGESDLDQMIAPVYTQYTNPVTTVLAAAGDIQIHLRARCATAEEAEALVSEVAAKIEPLLGTRLYTRTGQLLEEAVGELLLQKGATVSVAESCTGGSLAKRFTAVPGSSRYFIGGYITYTNRMKESLGVSADLLQQYGAVSEPVAIAMADKARQASGSDYALSVTGVAGPEGGTETTPVGTVVIGIAGPDDTMAKRFQFFGDRDRVRTLAAQYALDLLRLKLIG